MIGTALILAAGVGRRLEPLTSVRAKPAIPLAGVPLIVRIIDWLRGSGVTRVVINLHHRPETIAAVVGHGQALGVSVRYSWERTLLGSAGGPRHALPLIDEDPFLIVNGDTLAAVDLDGLAEAHRRSGAMVTPAVAPSPAPDKYGGVLVQDAAPYVEGFVRPGMARRHPDHFLGVQVASHGAFAMLPDNEPAESVWGHYPELMRMTPRALAAHRSRASFEDIGTLDDYLAASARRSPSALSNHVGARCAIADSARLTGTIVWDDVVIERDAHLEGCVVTDGVRVPAGAALTNRLLLRPPAGSSGKELQEIALPANWMCPR